MKTKGKEYSVVRDKPDVSIETMSNPGSKINKEEKKLATCPGKKATKMGSNQGEAAYLRTYGSSSYSPETATTIISPSTRSQEPSLAVLPSFLQYTSQ